MAEKKTSQPPRLSTAIAAARKTPEREGCWNEVEHLAAAVQRPEEVAELYREVLEKDLPAPVKTSIGLRALRFHDEWFGGEDSPALVAMLSRILEASPAEESALGRLTVVLTVGARWPELLGVYDRAIAATADPARRIHLLEEALQVAKDFAGESDRAIGYLQQLVPLRPGDAKLPRSLERLLESQERWRDLIEFWKARLGGESAPEARHTREAIAACWLERLDDPAAALDEIEVVLASPGDDAEACRLLERILGATAAEARVRLEAMSLLGERYEEAGRAEDIVRILGASLAFAPPEEQPQLHREVGDRLTALGREREALEHYVSLLTLAPGDVDAHDKLRRGAERTSSHARYVEGLLAAARTAAAEHRLELLAEAADVRVGQLADPAGAIELYASVLAESSADAAMSLRVARRLDVLLAEAERLPERLDVLERRATLEPASVVRRDLLGQAARLADRLGEIDRAERIWRSRVSIEGGDLEALDALVALLEREARWEPLIAVLRQRRDASTAASARRADLTRIARVYVNELCSVEPAILVWMEVAAEFGEDAESVDALSELLTKVGRWAELAKLLDRAADKDRARLAALAARLGDTRRERLDAPELAFAAYRRALEADPMEGSARAGMLALVDVPATRGAAARVLARAYESTDDWRLTLAILEPRLETAGSRGEQARVLREAASIHEEHGRDLPAALAALARALPFSPHDAELEHELERLAEATEDWRAAIAAYRGAADVVASEGTRAAEASRAGHLRRRQGDLLEERLSAHAEALDAYLDAARVDPTCAATPARVVRVGARSGRWNDVARAIVSAAAAAGAVDASLLAEVESVAEGNAWDSATRSLETAVRAEPGLAPGLAHAIEVRVALWHRDHRSDRAAAEAALLRAVGHDGARVDTLRTLADLQRQAPARPLFDTLLRLSDLRPRDLDVLREAAEVASGALASPDLARGVLTRLFDTAARVWRRGDPPHGELAAPEAVAWALARLCELYAAAGEYAAVVALLGDARRLPFDKDRARELAHRAAEVAARDLADVPRAIDIHREILDRKPDDALAIQRLAGLYQSSERLAELVALRRHELGLSSDRERRLELRLDISRLVGVIEERGGRVDVLRQNLEERPGHEASIEELCAVLESKGRYEGLCDLLTEQATKVEGRGEAARAAKLWSRVARLAEQDLADVDRAIAGHRHVVALEPLADSLDALARLHEGRAEHALAARWLERRLEGATDADRVGVALRLARAHVAAGQEGRAVGWLERTLLKHPAAKDLRELLASLYRGAESWAPLAKLLSEACVHAADDASRIAYVREAAALYHDRLGTPERAIPMLEQAMRLVPEDRWVKTTLAEGLRVAGRLPEAREILEGVIVEFGRRRSSERAVVHHQLARVLRALGKLGEALAQLDLASSMKPGDTAVLAMLGDVAREAGQLDRAEQAYRGLLLVVRRQSDAGIEAVGASEVLYALSRIAFGQGQKAQAEELAASAVQTASQSSLEARRFKRAAVRGEQPELALRAFETRLEFETEGRPRADALSEMADVLDAALGKPDEALDAWLRALDAAPEDPAIHASTRRLAARAAGTERYLERVTALIEARRRTEEAREVSMLLLRLGEAYEQDVGDLAKAVEIYGRVESMGELPLEANKALARVAGMRGVSVEQRRRLEEIVKLEGAPVELVVDALYRLADIDVASADRREQGLRLLEDALEKDPQYARAAGILKEAAHDAPDDVELWTLYQRVARVSGEDGMLLEYLERRAAHPGVTLVELREAIDLSARLGERSREEALLVRTIERARELGGGLGEAVWAPIALADRRKEAGDVTGAIRWLREAAEASDAEPSRELLLAAARLALDPARPAGEGTDGQLRAAVEIYEQVLERDAAARVAWEPLLDLHRRLGDFDRQATLVRATVDALADPAERNTLRMDHARYLLAAPGVSRRDEAQALLRDVLVEDPDHAEAQGLLGRLFEESGDQTGLSELLGRQLDAARDRRDAAAIGALSLRIAQVLGPSRRDEAMDALRSALEWTPDDRAVLQALVAMFTDDDDARERARRMEQLLAVENEGAGAELGKRLVALYESLEDEAGVQRALEGSYAAAPDDDTLRLRLQSWYEEREEWARLASMLEGDGARRVVPAAGVACYRQAASIHETRLGAPSAAASLIAKASALMPDDVSLLGELVRTRALAGEQRLAIEELGAALARREGGGAELVPLLRLRAELRHAIAREADAVQDLEQAFMLGGPEEGPRLVAGLHAWRDRAALGGDLSAERASTVRLVQVLVDIGDQDGARDALASWVASDPTDRDAIRSLREMDAVVGDWRAVADGCERLLSLEHGEDRVDSAMRLADACERAGDPAAARSGLEQAVDMEPSSEALRSRLHKLYETIGAYRELAGLVLAAGGDEADPKARFAALRRAGELYLAAGDAAEALGPLRTARELRPDDMETSLLLIDALIAGGLHVEAQKRIEAGIAAQGRRRTPDLAALQHRVARVAASIGDTGRQLEWLTTALETDRNNGEVAADLAELALGIGDIETAVKALRAVTLLKTPCRMSRALAFLRQAQIAHRQGEAQKALVFARRARAEDAQLAEATDFLRQIGDA